MNSTTRLHMQRFVVNWCGQSMAPLMSGARLGETAYLTVLAWTLATFATLASFLLIWTACACCSQKSQQDKGIKPDDATNQPHTKDIKKTKPSTNKRATKAKSKKSHDKDKAAAIVSQSAAGSSRLSSMGSDSSFKTVFIIQIEKLPRKQQDKKVSVTASPSNRLSKSDTLQQLDELSKASWPTSVRSINLVTARAVDEPSTRKQSESVRSVKNSGEEQRKTQGLSKLSPGAKLAVTAMSPASISQRSVSMIPTSDPKSPAPVDKSISMKLTPKVGKSPLRGSKRKKQRLEARGR